MSQYYELIGFDTTNGVQIPKYRALPAGAVPLTREQVDTAFHKMFGRMNNQHWIGYKGEFLTELFGPESEASGEEYNARTLGFTEGGEP